MAMPDISPIGPRRFPLTDIGNAERLVAQYGDNIRWLQAWKSWLVWDERRWIRDGTCRVEALAKTTVRNMLREATDLEGDTKKAIVAHAMQSESDSRIGSMIRRARAEDGIAIEFRELDQHPYLLTVQNGTLDLRTGTLGAHERGHLITKLVDVPFDPAAPCPTWEAFLHRIFDGRGDMIGYIQRAVGYSLTGDTGEQCLHLLHGSGSNGKSTFLEVLASLFGDYGVQADFATFLDKGTDGGPRNDVARLAGARMVRSSEVGEGKRLNEALVKSLTGTDTIAARFLYAESFEFRATFKLWLAANHKPVIRGADHAIWRRVRLIPFTVTIADAEKDPDLADKLRKELPGILAWAVAGCLLWRRDGLTPPPDVVAATAEYRSESDVLGAFLDECCETGHGGGPAMGMEVAATEIYTAFKRWAEENGEFVLTHTAFGRRLEERGFGVRKSGVKYRRGLRLLASPSKPHQTSWTDR
jgi:putative DNA primase/helicase